MFRRLYTKHFKKQLKSFLKKYPTLIEDVISFFEKFEFDQAVSLGGNLYKVRFKCSSLNKGKSGGFRIIILVFLKKETVVPTAIYFKGDLDSMDYNELLSHTEAVYNELEKAGFSFLFQK